VNQAEIPPAYVWLSEPEWDMGTDGGYAFTGVTTNQMSWSASTHEPWLSIPSTTGAAGSYLLVIVEPNAGPARSGVVTVSAGTASATLTVTQAGAPVATVSLSQTVWAPSSTAGSTGVVVTTNQPVWTAISNQPWLTLSPASGANGATMLVSAPANTGAARGGIVTVFAGSASATLTVTQAAAVVQPPPVGCGESYANSCPWNLAPIRVYPGPSGTALRFTAPVSGVYVFESSDRDSTSNPYGLLATAGGSAMAYDDDSAGDLNFRLSVSLVAGQTYHMAGLNRVGYGAFTISARLPG